ncbi:T9SS type A sorting domain-containing protein [Brumimicrobium aurantiacum]|nr:T9SS type A sorting domain-containing protein [Brumimicrobium aurantiacum]
MKTHLHILLLILLSSGLGFKALAQTQCTPTDAPFYEAFDSGIIPQCWENLSSIVHTSPENFWMFNDQGDYGSANNGRSVGTFAKADGSNPNPDSLMLISPEINLTPLTTPYLSFEWYSDNTNYPGDNNPLIIDVYDGTTWTNLDTLSGDSTAWLFQNYDLSAFMNQTIQVRFMVNQTLTSNHPIYNDILLDEVRIDNCVSTTGQDGSATVCITGDLVNLDDSIIVKPNGGGYWSYPSQPNLVYGAGFDVSTLNPGGTYEVFYIERLVCYDTTVATITFYSYDQAGNNGQGQVCENEPVGLFSFLSGNSSLGGTWYDFIGNQVAGSMVTAPGIPGSYDYLYVVENTNCDDDTAVVNLNVFECGLGIDNNAFNQISIAPNPATTHINIQNSFNVSALKFEMLDMNGRTVRLENSALNNTGKVTLSIDHLEKGIYTLRIYNTDESKTFKVVKQ